MVTFFMTRNKKELHLMMKLFLCPGLESNQHILANGRF